MNEYKEDDENNISKSLNDVDEENLKINQENDSWDEASINSFRTQFSILLQNKATFPLLCDSIKLIKEKVGEIKYITCEFSDLFRKLLEKFLYYEDELIKCGIGECFFSLLCDLTYYDSGLKLLQDLDIFDFISLVFTDNVLIGLFDNVLDFMSIYAKNGGKDVLIYIYDSIPFMETIEKWLPLTDPEDDHLLNFFYTSIIDEIPIETAEIIMLFIKIIIDGKHFSANNILIIFKMFNRLLNHPLTDDLIPKFIEYHFSDFFLYILENNIPLNTKNANQIQLLKECLFCSTLLFQNTQCENFIPFINYAIQCFSEKQLKTESLALITELCECNHDTFTYFQENYEYFIEHLIQEFHNETFKEKKQISHLFLFIILHSEDQKLLNYMIEQHFFFPFMNESLSFATHQKVSIDALQLSYDILQSSFPLFPNSPYFNDDNEILLQIMDMIEELQDCDDEELCEKAKFFLSQFHQPDST